MKNQWFNSNYMQIASTYCPNISEDVVCFIADDGNHFTKYGITEGMLLIFDKNKSFKEGHLSCYADTLSDGTKEYRLSNMEQPDSIYIGRMVMAVRNYEV